MTSKDKLSLINEAIKAGRTVYICNHMKQVKVTPKTYKKWADSGYYLFKDDGQSLYMARGKNYDCIDYCAIRTS